MSKLITGVAVALSALALVFSGFVAYRVFSLEQDIKLASRAVESLEKSQATPKPDDIVTSAPSAVLPASTGGGIQPSNPGPSNSIQPGQFLQPALGNQARIELLGVKRVQDPKTGQQNAVNVLFRVYRVVENPERVALIDISQTTARNPETSEVYEAYRDKKFANSSILLSLLKRNIPEDGYVWLQVPEGVKTLHIYIPETQVFKNVPITG